MPTTLTLSSTDPFFEQPILNLPYQCPSRYWEPDTVV